MKKILTLLLALVMVMTLAACGEGDTPNPGTTQGTTPPATTTPTADTTTAPVDVVPETTAPQVEVPENDYFAFVADGVELIPGGAFDPAKLAAAEFTYETPSCAFEGTDTVYSYAAYDLTAYNEGDGLTIYSILLFDANTPTPEGLYLGDDTSIVTSLYGDNYEEDGTQWIYRRGETMLVLIFQGDYVASIEYRQDIQ